MSGRAGVAEDLQLMVCGWFDDGVLVVLVCSWLHELDGALG